MNTHGHDIDTLIAKFLAGEASPEEAIALHDWIDESAANKQVFEQAETVWMLHANERYKKPDLNETFDNLNEVIDYSPKRFFTIRSIAAILVLSVLLVSGILYLMQTNVETLPDSVWITKNSIDSIKAVSLPEGTSVTLNKHSQLRYQTSFSRQRVVELEGEAYFQVTSDPQKPFTVSASELEIKVLGTKFNVSAHATDSLVRIQVLEGKVRVVHKTDSIVLVANDQAFYNKKTQVLRLGKTAGNNEAAYATRQFVYEDQSLKRVLENLSTVYGVTFTLENEKVNDCRLTGEYNNMELATVLEVITRSLDLTYRINGNQVYISGDGCL